MEVQETVMETDLTDGDGGSTWSLSVPTSTSNLNFHLTFDRDLAVFMPGQTVSGVIYFQLLVPESFKGLFIFFFKNKTRKSVYSSTTSDNLQTIKKTTTTSSVFILSGLTVECIGMSKVQWTETETVGRDTETTVFSASETYYNQKTLILPGKTLDLEKTRR